ncbi:MAG: hypothetical protein B6I18_07325 [Bacteroidetes bacterium 4572_112]|nr:MAG: hypothetical protein B6I18_07325 [Bacteroidetes bacterium 4572_112]
MWELYKKYKYDFPIIIAFIVFVLLSYFYNYNPGISIFEDNFWGFIKEMILALPVMFILVGLFDVWVSRERVQKHIGESSGIRGMMLIMLLAFIQAGPIYAAFPVAYILWKKGTSARNIFIYLSSASIAKIPMLAFEIGFLGLKFSLLRIFISIPIFIIVATIMGKYFTKNNCEVKNG